MRALKWLAAIPLLIVMIYGVALVVAFAFDATSLLWAFVGATLGVLGWHGLRRLEPRPEPPGPPDDWAHALSALAGFIALMLLVHWNPWLLAFGWVVFPLWLRLRRRS